MFCIVGKTKGWWTVQALGASKPLSRRASSLTPCAPPPPDANTETQLGGDAPADDAEPPKKPAVQPKKRGRPPKVVEDAPAAELGASEAASSLEAKIKAAIAKKPDVSGTSHIAGTKMLATIHGEKTLVCIDTNPWLGMQASGGIPTGKNHLGKALMVVTAISNTFLPQIRNL